MTSLQQSATRRREIPVRRPHLGQDHLLAVLWERDGRTPGEVAVAPHVTTPAVTKAAARLTSAGLLTRRSGEHNNRLVRLWLTEPGRALPGPVEAERRGLDEQLTAELTAGEGEHLLTALTKIHRAATGLVARADYDGS